MNNNNENKPNILCVGEMVADLMVKPVPGIDFSVDSLPVDQIELQNGGDALNVSVNLAKLGVKVDFIGKAGRDPFGDFLVDAARTAGVGVKHMAYTETVPSSKVIGLIREDGERCFLHFYGSNSSFSLEDIDLALLKSISFLHIGGTFHLPRFDGGPAAALLKQAREYGIATSMDVAWDSSGRWLETLQPCLKHLDYFIPSENEAREITGHKTVSEMAQFLKDQGVRNVIIKLGSQGVYYSGKLESFFCNAYSVSAVDTTGAGDAFVSGLLRGLLYELPIHSCITIGTAASAHVIQEIGATAGMPDFLSLMNYINSKPKLEITYD